jgi:endonuclease/exonuclease/phosphatase family metal-dependent hydrolase
MTAVRALTINFWGTEPDLDARLALAVKQLEGLEPDIIGMQEVRPLDGRQGRTTADHIADALGMSCVYEVSLEWDDDAFFEGHPGGQEGLAILSRYPIVEHYAKPLPHPRPTERRILLCARIDVNGTDLWFHTTHLHYRLDDGLAREAQVLAVDDTIKSIGTNPQIVCGDFNSIPDSDEMRFLRGLTTLEGRRTHFQDAYLRTHPQDGPAGYTWCAQNPQTRALRSLDINRRIDYIYVTTRRKDGRGTVNGAGVVLTDRDDDGNCASDHYGVMADIDIS